MINVTPHHTTTWLVIALGHRSFTIWLANDCTVQRHEITWNLVLRVSVLTGQLFLRGTQSSETQKQGSQGVSRWNSTLDHLIVSLPRGYHHGRKYRHSTLKFVFTHDMVIIEISHTTYMSLKYAQYTMISSWIGRVGHKQKHVSHIASKTNPKTYVVRTGRHKKHLFSILIIAINPPTKPPTTELSFEDHRQKEGGDGLPTAVLCEPNSDLRNRARTYRSPSFAESPANPWPIWRPS